MGCGRNIKDKVHQQNHEEDHVDSDIINCSVCGKIHAMETQVKKHISQSSQVLQRRAERDV